MDFVNRIASFSLFLAAFVFVIICQTSTARSIPYYNSEYPFALEDSYLSSNQQQQSQQYQQPSAEEPVTSPHQLAKRRLVVRVPFAQSPDSVQLHRLYKTLFNDNKQKKFMSLQALL